MLLFLGLRIRRQIWSSEGGKETLRHFCPFLQGEGKKERMKEKKKKHSNFQNPKNDAYFFDGLEFYTQFLKISFHTLNILQTNVVHIGTLRTKDEGRQWRANRR